MGNRIEEETTRRAAVVYHFSPAVVASGIGLLVLGTAINVFAQKAAERTVELREKELREGYIKKCDALPQDRREICSDQLEEVVTAYGQYARHEQWVEGGGQKGEVVATGGLGVLAVGVGIKAVDVFIRRRAEGKKRQKLHR